MKFRDNFLRDYYEFKDSREIGKQWETLATAVDVLMVQLVRRKHSQGLLNCLTLFNQLTLNNNLILL